MNLDRYTEATEHLHLALAHLAADMPDEALRSVGKCLELEPGSSAARLAEARIQLARHQPRLALKALDAHDHYHPERRETPQVMMLRARALVRTSGDALSRSLLENLAARFPDDARAHRMLAGLCIKQDQLDRAIVHLRQVVRLEPSDTASRSTLATLLGRHQPEAAAELLRSDPTANDPPDRRLTAARLYTRAERYREAEELYAPLLTERRDEAALWQEAGTLADAMGDDTLAIARLGRAVQLTEMRDPTALAALAAAHMHAGRLAIAGRWWWRLTRRQPHDTQARGGLIVCALAAGKLRLARRALRILNIRTAPHERRQTLSALWFHAAVGQSVRRARRGELQSVKPVTSALSMMLSKASVTLLRHARRLPQRADTHYHLAVCYDATGNAPAARQSVDRALRINPNYTSAKQVSQRLAA